MTVAGSKNRWTLVAAMLFGLSASVMYLGERLAPAAVVPVQLTATPLQLDLGDVAPREAAHGQFKLTNPSENVTIHITNVHPACGCTVPKLSSDHIPPKNAVSLSIYLSSPAEPQELTKTILVDYQVGESIQVETLILSVRGNVSSNST